MNVKPEDKRFFLQTLDDIEHKLRIGDSYNIIRSAGLIRHLLLDREPLALKINREFRINIEFIINDNLDAFDEMFEDMEGENFTPIGAWSILTPIVTEYSVKLKLREFLKRPVVKHDGHKYTVKDVIQYTSTFLGGIHTFSPNKEDELAFKEMNIKLNDLNLNLISLASISGVVLKALSPLKKRLK